MIPAFMVRNHAELKRGKPRMVINYKELNKNCIFDEYFIPNKNNLINLAKVKNHEINYITKYLIDITSRE